MPELIKRNGSVIVIPHPDDEKKRSADRRYLIIRRSSQVIAPGKLCFPGGGIEPGESPEDAARRECYEEIGGRITNLIQIWENITPWHIHLFWFYGELLSRPSDLRPAPAEVSEIVWLDLASLLKHPDTLTSNTPFLTGVLEGTIPIK